MKRAIERRTHPRVGVIKRVEDITYSTLRAQRPLKFRAHFNRINMQRGNPNVWTVHNSHACYQVQKIDIQVPVESVFNPGGTQPRAYFSGRGVVTIEGSTAVIR